MKRRHFLRGIPLTGLGALAGCVTGDEADGRQGVVLYSRPADDSSGHHEQFPTTVTEQNVQIEPGSFYEFRFDLLESGKTTYTITGDGNFDVFVFATARSQFADYLQKMANDGDSWTSAVAEDRDTGGESNALVVLPTGRYHLVVDNSGYGGEADGDRDAVHVDVDVQMTQQGL